MNQYLCTTQWYLGHTGAQQAASNITSTSGDIMTFEMSSNDFNNLSPTADLDHVAFVDSSYGVVLPKEIRK